MSDDFYKRLDARIREDRIARIFKDRLESLHDYQGCAKEAGRRGRDSTMSNEVKPERVVELSKLYLDVALNLEMGTDETRQAATDTVHALAELERARKAVELLEECEAVMLRSDMSFSDWVKKVREFLREGEEE